MPTDDESATTFKQGGGRIHLKVSFGLFSASIKKNLGYIKGNDKN